MVPIRSCIACRVRISSKELLHLVVVDGRVIPDPIGKLQGRGAWLHLQCFELATQRRSFNRAFKSGEDLITHDLEIFIKSTLMNNKEQK